MRFLGRLPVVPLDFAWLVLPVAALIVISSANSCNQRDYATVSYSPQKSQNTVPAPTRVATQRPAQTLSAADRQLENLDKDIEAGKTSLSSIEAALKRQETQVSAMANRIESLSLYATQLERAISTGDVSDTLLYEEVIRHHNLLIDSVDEMTQRYERTFAQYEKMYDSVSAWIVRYNAMR